MPPILTRWTNTCAQFGVDLSTTITPKKRVTATAVMSFDANDVHVSMLVHRCNLLIEKAPGKPEPLRRTMRRLGNNPTLPLKPCARLALLGTHLYLIFHPIDSAEIHPALHSISMIFENRKALSKCFSHFRRICVDTLNAMQNPSLCRCVEDQSVAAAQ